MRGMVLRRGDDGCGFVFYGTYFFGTGDGIAEFPPPKLLG